MSVATLKPFDGLTVESVSSAHQPLPGSKPIVDTPSAIQASFAAAKKGRVPLHQIDVRSEHARVAIARVMGDEVSKAGAEGSTFNSAL